MPVPNTLSDISTVAATNSPQGTESAKGTIDDYLRTAFAFIAQLVNLAGGPTTTLASSASVAIGFANTANIGISGNAVITSFDSTAEGALRHVVFSGTATLTHNAASLILPGAANIVTASGDAALFKSLGAGNWRCIGYQRAAAAPNPASATSSGYLTAADWSAFNAKQVAGACLPLAGGTMSGRVTFTNNAGGINFLDAGGAAHTFAVIDGGNNVNLFNAGGQLTRIWNQAGGAILWSIDDNGNTSQIGDSRANRLVANDGTQAAPSVSFGSDTDTGLFHISDGVIGIACNGALVGKFTSAGLEVLKIIQTAP